MEIKLIGVWYRYGGSREWALKEVSIDLRSAEVVYVDGHNGSGKTTLLKIASLLYQPSKGHIIVDGENFWGLDEGRRTSIRRRVVYVHEKPVLLNGTVLDNVAYGLQIRGISRDKALENSMKVLSMFSIDALAHTPVRKLSTGQAQLVAIARALAVEPDILFLDEPFSNLDRERRGLLISTLNRFRSAGMGIVLSSHSIDVGELGRHRRIVLENGEVIKVYEFE
ncbi:MAG: ATP-binding cassette domain-containing protein [Ignisphaera sp.]|nr:ATP-binding cassette domain-containing protein [Ignisphaera sp.]MDW8084711.1 ATP-binding cassette domain-containing protein [Ignisphaera sp.]